MNPTLRKILIIATKNAVNAAAVTIMPMIDHSDGYNFHNWAGVLALLRLIVGAILIREAIFWIPELIKWSQSPTNGGTIMKTILFVLLLFIFVTPTLAQTPVSKDPLEGGWNVSVNGGYSGVSNAQTNNGFFFSTSIRVAQHFNARGDVFVLTDPAVTVSLVKPEYRFSALHLFKNAVSPTVRNTEFFINAGLGSAHYSDPIKGQNSKFAWGLGGGFDVKLTDTVSIRPLDVNYIRSSLIGGGRVIGNHLQFAAGLGLRF